MKKEFLFPVTTLLVGFLLSATLQLQAADHYVTVDGFGFSPAELTVDVGDTVIWINTDETFPHTTTSDLLPSNPNYWNGFMPDEGSFYPHTFINPGKFTYRDQADIGTGTITVIVPNNTPTITLESPRIEDSQFLFEATGLTAGRTNVLQASTNLITWLPISTNVAETASMTFTNDISLSHRFFQVFELQ